MAVPVQNDFEEGTNGTTITTGNSGGAGENAFDAVVIGTSATVAFSNTQAAHGTLAGKFATGASSAAAYVSWHSSIGSQSTLYGRFYLYLTGYPPSGGTRLIQFWNGGDNVTYCAGLDLSSSGYLAIQNSAFTWTVNFSNTIPLNQWVRVEFKYTFGTSTGSATVNYYSSLDSTTITEGHTATSQSFGASTADTIDIGWAFALANQPTMYMDNILVNAVGFPGPAVNSVQRNQISTRAAGTGTSFTIPFTTANNPTAGSKVVATIALYPNSSSVITSVVDNGTSPATFTQDVTQNFIGSGSVSIWRADNITLPASGAYTITVTLSSSQTYSAGALSYTNVASGGPTASNSTSGQNNSPLTGFAESAGKGALYVAGYTSNSGNTETITATATGFVNEFTQTAGSSNLVFAYTDKIDYAGPTNTQSTWSLSDAPQWAGVIVTYDIVATTVTGTSTTAFQSFTFVSSGSVSGPSGTGRLAFQPLTFSASGTNTGATIFANNVVAGNVLNDYGLDNVPYTVGTTGPTTMLVAWVGWDVAQLTYQSTGMSPAVNVTDSAGNLWRQVGISTAATAARGALWVADNPRQTSWVSVALTGWGYSTSYIIAELDGLPTSMGAVSLDFVATTNGTVGTSLTLASTATTSDIGIGVVATGGNGGGLTVPVNWLGVGAAGGSTSAAATTYAMWTPNITAGAVSWNPTWATSQPYSGIFIGLKKTAPAPVQSNPNFPTIVVEAAFGATPGNPSQSVDYTWDVTGLTWTDISSRCFSKGDDATIEVTRGRQYELSEEETGEITILLDNHDGALTYGNVSSPYYSNALNQNMSFQTGVSPWIVSADGTTIGQSTAHTFASAGSAAYSALITCGTSANPGITSPNTVPVTASFTYTASAWFFSAAGYASGAQTGVNWYTSSGSYISTSAFTTLSLPAGQWVQCVAKNLPAPSNAAFANVVVQLTGTPGAGVQYWVAEAALAPGSGVLTGLVIPGVPIRITAWWQGTQYPVAFGYVEKWPQEWPDMPQWGFSTVVATDAYGPLAATNLPSAVAGDIKIDSPYAYFPTNEQYSFTSQSLTPIATPIDANGLIAVNQAFGNNRFAAYRDGTDQAVTVGQALSLLGSQDTTLGATNYTSQETGANGPGLFYFDPNIPTNASNGSFSVEYWFVWGNGNAFSNTYFSAWGAPSSYFVKGGASNNGGVITVGVNTGVNTTAATGLWVNGVEVSKGTFNQSTFAPQHFVLTAGPNGTACFLNGVQCGTQPTLGTISQIRAVSLGPARFSYDVNDNVVYNGYNFIAGHLALYAQELTPQMIANHYTGGINGWVGTPAPGRFAQLLTWGRLGLKRGGTAWYQTYGTTEDTYMSEAYSIEGSSAAEAISQVVKTEGGRCFSQGNGSVVYLYRWSLYNRPTVATFGDNNTTEIPFEQDTSFAVDLQFVYNQISATQTRGPAQDFYVTENNFPSQYQYFNRNGLSLQSYAMLPFDVYDIANWSMNKYNQPVQRVVQINVDVAKVQSKFTQAFPVVLGLELNEVVTVNRRPVGGAIFSTTGSVQKINHNIGAAYWKTTYQIAPDFPESNTLIADVNGQNSPGSQYLSW